MPRIALIAIVALVAAASPAAAAPQLVTRTSGNVALGPALAGERLFYGELGRSAMALRIATIGAGTRRLDTVSRPGSSSENEVSPGDYSIVSSSLAASPERLAFVQLSSAGNARYQQGQNSIRQLGGTPTGRLSTLAQCGNQSYYGPGSSTVDVDGTRTAATDCAGRIVIRDHDAVVATVEAGPGLAVGTLALAGRYVAYNAYAVPPFTTPTATVVHDWTTNSKVYEVPRATSFDLQADGTLAVATVPDATCERSVVAYEDLVGSMEVDDDAYEVALATLDRTRRARKDRCRPSSRRVAAAGAGAARRGSSRTSARRRSRRPRRRRSRSSRARP